MCKDLAQKSEKKVQSFFKKVQSFLGKVQSLIVHLQQVIYQKNKSKMLIPIDAPPYVLAWVELKKPNLMRPTKSLMDPEREEVLAMMPLAKLTRLKNKKPINWKEWSDLEKIAIVLFGDAKKTKLLFFDPLSKIPFSIFDDWDEDIIS